MNKQQQHQGFVPETVAYVGTGYVNPRLPQAGILVEVETASGLIFWYRNLNITQAQAQALAGEIHSRGTLDPDPAHWHYHGRISDYGYANPQAA